MSKKGQATLNGKKLAIIAKIIPKTSPITFLLFIIFHVFLILTNLIFIFHFKKQIYLNRYAFFVHSLPRINHTNNT